MAARDTTSTPHDGAAAGAGGPMASHEAMGGPASAPLVDRLRTVHLAMVEAVLSGDGLGRVAELAAHEARAPVAIVVPRLDIAAAHPPESGAELATVAGYVAEKARGRPVTVPASVALEVPIVSGDEHLGAVLLLEAGYGPRPEAAEFLHLAAVASLTEAAIVGAREEVEANVRGSFLEELRTR